MAYSEASAARFEAPVFLGGMFGGGGGESSDEEGESAASGSHGAHASAAAAGVLSRAERAAELSQSARFETTSQSFPHINMHIRQFDDHHRNANICWPEA